MSILLHVHWNVCFLVLVFLMVYPLGILDQGKGVLILFEDTSVDETFVSALNTIGQLGNVVDSLYKKAKHIQ